MDYMHSNLEVRTMLAEATKTNPDDWFLCLKARFGMQIVFESIKDVCGSGEVITCPYTCITAVNPIIAAKMKPIYADCDSSLLWTKKPDEHLYSTRTKAIVMQHTLGLIGDKSPLVSFAHKHNLILIEDSAHCLTRMYRNRQNQIEADISVHSFGVEKVLQSSKFGGVIYINPGLKQKNPKLYTEVTNRLLALKQPNAGLAFRIRNYRYNNAVLQRLPKSLRSPYRDLMIKAKLLEAPIFPYEQNGQQAKAYTTNNFINKKIISLLPNLKSNYSKRNSNVKKYQKHLSSDKFSIINPDTAEPLLAFPILFKTAKQANDAYAMLCSSGFFIRRWYSPLLFPGPSYMNKYSYKPEMAPKAEDISTRILCLPTDLSDSEINRIIKLLK